MLMPLKNIIEDFNLKIKGVIHIGAHYGEEYKIYSECGIKNMIFFEPVQSNYKILVDSLLGNARTYNLALGNETGEREMYIETVNAGQSCSLLEPGTHLSSYPGIKFDKKEIVKVDKLDNIPFDRTMYNMVNIDVQGYELEVFKGAIETLKSIDIIYTEVNFEEVYKNCCLVSDLDSFLIGFKRVLADSSPRTWGDALYIR